jgi:hypothetical protein
MKLWDLSFMSCGFCCIHAKIILGMIVNKNCWPSLVVEIMSANMKLIYGYNLTSQMTTMSPLCYTSDSLQLLPPLIASHINSNRLWIIIISIKLVPKAGFTVILVLYWHVTSFIRSEFACIIPIGHKAGGHSNKRCQKHGDSSYERICNIIKI